MDASSRLRIGIAISRQPATGAALQLIPASESALCRPDHRFRLRPRVSLPGVHRSCFYHQMGGIIHFGIGRAPGFHPLDPRGRRLSAPRAKGSPKRLALIFEELVAISRPMRRDRDLAFYGSEDLTPYGFYSRSDAKTAPAGARRVVDAVTTPIKR